MGRGVHEGPHERVVGGKDELCPYHALVLRSTHREMFYIHKIPFY
jgi:hypothetical protein